LPGEKLMAITLTEDFVTLEDLGKNAAAILRQVHRLGRPVIVTVDGKPDVVIVDVAVYEKKMHLLTLARKLAEAQADVKAGRVRPLEEFLSELEHDTKVSS
jgi:prevent-host-death family protein